jgi:hypothetical protein
MMLFRDPKDVRIKINVETDISNPDVKSLIHVINLLGKDLVGLELGTYRGESFVTLLQCCPNIKKLHGCDTYKEFGDYFQIPYDPNTPRYINDKIDQEFNELLCKHYIKNSGASHKAVLHKKDSMQLVKEFDDNSLDFIFMDSYLTIEQMQEEIKAWYPKVKDKGLFSGHDWGLPELQNFVHKFRKDNEIVNFLSTYDNAFCWIK